MPESSNVEIAHKLSEHRGAESSKESWQDVVVEILEALLLGVVAVATAWSAYSAAKWDGQESELYGQASALRIEADQHLTLGGQQCLLDVSTFNTWIQARSEGNDELAALYVRRFSNEFKVAFDAWLKTNPFSNPTAPCLSLVGLRICWRVGGTRDIPVEALFPQGGGCFELTSGWSRVLGMDAIGGPPHSYVADERAARMTSRSCPDRLGVTLARVVLNLVREIGYQPGSLCQVVAPDGMGMER